MDHLIQLLSSILVPLFFVGIAGSLLVVIVTTLRDLHEIFTKEEDGEL
jgi:hypothetical protein